MEVLELKQYLQSLCKLGDKDRENRIAKAKDDFRFFVYTYLGHHIGLNTKETSNFRNFIYDNLPKLQSKNNKLLFEAYRGGAKTTLISRLFVLWQICSNKVRYPIIISSTLDIAQEGLELISLELEDNVNLRSDFNVRCGNIWSKDEIIVLIDNKPIKVKVFGAGKKIRGTNFLSNRPDLIICDDIENDENVQSKTQRDKLLSWFNKAILKLPSRLNKYCIIVVGTTLHYDSLLCNLAKRDDFITHSFPLVISFPKNLESINKANLKSQNLSSMILDDKKIDKYEVMSDFLEDRSSFYSEFQNLPLDKENAPLSTFSTYTYLPKDIDAIVLGVDPSMGKKRGDYFGVSVLHLSNKNIFWEAYGFKKNIDEITKNILSIAKKKNKLCSNITIAVESIAFQEFYKEYLGQKIKNIGLFIPVVGVKNTQNKEVRLDGLNPLLKDGSILIDDNSPLLKEELETYPKGSHDDLIDSGDIALGVIKNKARCNYKAIRESFSRYKDVLAKTKDKYV